MCNGTRCVLSALGGIERGHVYSPGRHLEAAVQRHRVHRSATCKRRTADFRCVCVCVCVYVVCVRLCVPLCVLRSCIVCACAHVHVRLRWCVVCRCVKNHLLVYQTRVTLEVTINTQVVGKTRQNEIGRDSRGGTDVFDVRLSDHLERLGPAVSARKVTSTAPNQTTLRLAWGMQGVHNASSAKPYMNAALLGSNLVSVTWLATYPVSPSP